jgi:hypothetical protein
LERNIHRSRLHRRRAVARRGLKLASASTAAQVLSSQKNFIAQIQAR